MNQDLNSSEEQKMLDQEGPETTDLKQQEKVSGANDSQQLQVPVTNDIIQQKQQAQESAASNHQKKENVSVANDHQQLQVSVTYDNSKQKQQAQGSAINNNPKKKIVLITNHHQQLQVPVTNDESTLQQEPVTNVDQKQGPGTNVAVQPKQLIEVPAKDNQLQQQQMPVTNVHQSIKARLTRLPRNEYWYNKKGNWSKSSENLYFNSQQLWINKRPKYDNVNQPYKYNYKRRIQDIEYSNKKQKNKSTRSNEQMQEKDAPSDNKSLDSKRGRDDEDHFNRASISMQMPMPMPSMHYDKFGDNRFGLSVQFLESLCIDGPLVDRVFVENLECNVNEETLKDVFSIAGKVMDVEVVRDDDGKSKGFGFIKFDHPVEAVQAVSMLHNQLYFDRPMSVQLAKEDEAIKLPLGLKATGPGLGVNGTSLKDVARTDPVHELARPLKKNITLESKRMGPKARGAIESSNQSSLLRALLSGSGSSLPVGMDMGCLAQSLNPSLGGGFESALTGSLHENVLSGNVESANVGSTTSALESNISSGLRLTDRPSGLKMNSTGMQSSGMESSSSSDFSGSMTSSKKNSIQIGNVPGFSIIEVKIPTGESCYKETLMKVFNYCDLVQNPDRLLVGFRPEVDVSKQIDELKKITVNGISLEARCVSRMPVARVSKPMTPVISPGRLMVDSQVDVKKQVDEPKNIIVNFIPLEAPCVSPMKPMAPVKKPLTPLKPMVPVLSPESVDSFKHLIVGSEVDVSKQIDELKKITVNAIPFEGRCVTPMKPISHVLKPMTPGSPGTLHPLKRYLNLKPNFDIETIKNFYNAEVEQKITDKGNPSQKFVLTFSTAEEAVNASQKLFSLDGKPISLTSFRVPGPQKILPK